MEVKSINGYSIKDEKAIRTYDTVALMQADLKLSVGQHVKTRGYYEINDGGNSEYIIVNDNSLSIDNGSVINLNNGLIAKLIVSNNMVNVKQFGAKGDNETNDTNSIQNTVNYAKLNKYTLFIPKGTYLVSNILINGTLIVKGEGTNTVIKSIDNNESDSIIKLLNNGCFRSEIANLRINGNIANNDGTTIDGLMLTLDSNGTAGDMWTNIHDLIIQNCSGNGISIVSDVSISAIREIRVDNINITSNGENGLFMNACADSYFSRISSHSNNKHGFVFDNGVHKCSDLKAFWNGLGDNETIEDTNRLPEDAFEETTDETAQTGKQYYTRTGTGVNGDLYVYEEHTGAFEQDVTYYEMVKNYYKKYAGFLIKTRRSLFSNCEAQDNQGDGFYVTGSFNTISFTSDNNGLLTDSSNNPVSYDSQNKTQIYYGIYNRSNRGCVYNGCVGNFRYSNIGACQKSPFFFRSASHISGSIQTENCLHDYIEYRNAGNNCTLECNCKPFIYSLDLTTFNYLNSFKNKTNDITSNDSNYIYKIDNVVYYRLVLKKTDNTAVLPDSEEYGVLDLPVAFRPTHIIYKEGYTSGSGGYTVTNGVSYRISDSGRITAKGGTNNHIDSNLVLEGSYPLD